MFQTLTEVGQEPSTAELRHVKLEISILIMVIGLMDLSAVHGGGQTFPVHFEAVNFHSIVEYQSTHFDRVICQPHTLAACGDPRLQTLD